MIGGPICKEPLPARLLPGEPRSLTHAEVDALWRIFVAIGRAWNNVQRDSAGLKSAWLEFVTLKTRHRPSFVAEYVSAIEVVEELVTHHRGNEDAAFDDLFFHHGIPADSLETRLAHAKHFVVDEFIRVQVTAGGFKEFLPPVPPATAEVTNYNGYIAGSRYNRIRPVRTFKAPR